MSVLTLQGTAALFVLLSTVCSLFHIWAVISSLSQKPLRHIDQRCFSERQREKISYAFTFCLVFVLFLFCVFNHCHPIAVLLLPFSFPFPLDRLCIRCTLCFSHFSILFSSPEIFAIDRGQGRGKGGEEEEKGRITAGSIHHGKTKGWRRRCTELVLTAHISKNVTGYNI